MRALFLSLFLLGSVSIQAQVQEFKLDNGLRVIVKTDHRAPVAVSMVWYNVGSADEPGGITGVSHALEHLMFKGTPRFPLGVFSKTIANLGGQENAFTSTDYTAYFEKIAAIHLAVAFELEADRMQQLQFNADEFKKEMRVIQEERRLRTDDNPQALTYERFSAAAHLAAPYQHPVIGWMSDIKQLQIADAASWYHHYYSPNNATLVVVGDVSPLTIRDLAQRYFGKLTPIPQTPRKPQREPLHLGKKIITVHAPAQVPSVMVGYTVPSVKTATKGHENDPYALEIIAGILDAGDSSRFNARLVRGQHVASSVAVQYSLYSRYESQLMIYGTPSQSHSIDQLKDAIQIELQHFKDELINEKELSRIKNQIIAEKTFERDSIFSQAMELGLLETTGLGWKTAESYVDKIASITPNEIQQAARRYFNEKNETEALLIPAHSSGDKA